MGGVAYAIFFTPFFQIKHIEIQGNQTISGERLREIVETYLPKKFIFFEIHHFLFADREGVVKGIHAAFPEIESVAARKKFPDALWVQVQERQGIAVWCQEKSYTVEVSDEGGEKRTFRQCFALDKHGVIFEEKEPEREVIVSRNEGRELNLGEEVIHPELLAKILSFQQQLDVFSLFREVGLRVSSIAVVSEERVNVKISEGWEIYLNPAENIDWQVTKLKLVLEKEIPSAKRPFLEYIDLRFGDQAYIKYR